MFLHIPVKPHIKEFFTSAQMFGQCPIDVRRNSRLGELLAATFSQYPLRDEDLEDLEAVPVADPATLTLKLTFALRTQLITDAKLAQFAKVLETFFELYAIAFVKGRMDSFPSANGASERFVKLHGLSDEHYSADAVRKMVSRTKSVKDPFFNKATTGQKTNHVQFSPKAVQVAA